MDEPSQLARAHTRLLRQSIDPPAGTRARNWEHIESALEFGEVASVGGASWLSAHAIKAFVITVGVGTLGLVGVDIVVDRGAESPAGPAGPKVEHPQPAAEPAAPAPKPAPAIVSPTPPAKTAEPEAVPAKQKPRKAQDPLAAELTLTDQIKKAYRAGDLQRAAELAERHRARFPTGVFAPERDAILAEHACTTGDHEAADAFVKRHGSSPLAKRVAVACDGE